MAGKAGKRLEGFAGISTIQECVQIQLRQQHRVAQIITLGQSRHEQAQLAELEFAQMHRSRFQEEGGALGAAAERDAAHTELVEELLRAGP